ncbi:hypothetical protein BV898_10371 [Hypsibius exemplaris]|uniref:Spaetzle domain-containing protein n=1 Tax=Hypsibius exemplaris TaxID=2072580 RepID=A0A1W0WJW8_HYPEX|nr:hypothetical protein BV898_10371 [Hypsibius exemplaris]
MQRREGGSLICDSERNYQIGIGEHSTHRTGDMRRDHWVIPLRQLWFIVLVNLLTNDSIAAQAFTSFDDSPSPSDNYIPRSRPDFNFADIPCDLKENNFCTRAGKAYPWYGIGNFIADNRAMIKRLYGSENQRGPSANHAQGPITTRQGKSVAGTGTNACPSEQFVVTPFWANNSDGNTLALVNFHPFEQAIQQEICKTGVQGRCRDGCQCEQKHAWYRLLAFDPRNECKGIFMDWFQFPSCCSCNCYDNLPVRDASSSSTTPSTSTLPTVEAKSDEGLSAKLINVSAMAEGPPTTSQLSTSSLTSQKTVSHTSSSINITTTSTSTLLPKSRTQQPSSTTTSPLLTTLPAPLNVPCLSTTASSQSATTLSHPRLSLLASAPATSRYLRLKPYLPFRRAQLLEPRLQMQSHLSPLHPNILGQED